MCRGWKREISSEEEPNAWASAQERRLMSLQFAWSVDVQAARWHHLFHEARRFKARSCAAASAHSRPRSRHGHDGQSARVSVEGTVAQLASCTAGVAGAASACSVRRRTCRAPLPPVKGTPSASGWARLAAAAARAARHAAWLQDRVRRASHEVRAGNPVLPSRARRSTGTRASRTTTATPPSPAGSRRRAGCRRAPSCSSRASCPTSATP